MATKPLNVMTATTEELVQERDKLQRKNFEMETIINSLGASPSPMLPLDLKISSLIELVVAMDPDNQARIEYIMALKLNEFFTNTLPEVRQRALMMDPNAGAPGLIVPGR